MCAEGVELKRSPPCRVTQSYLATVLVLPFTIIRTEQLATTTCKDETFVSDVPPEQHVSRSEGAVGYLPARQGRVLDTLRSLWGR